MYTIVFFKCSSAASFFFFLLFFLLHEENVIKFSLLSYIFLNRKLTFPFRPLRECFWEELRVFSRGPSLFRAPFPHPFFSGGSLLGQREVARRRNPLREYSGDGAGSRGEWRKGGKRL
ncbi:hypothetical protein PUN28_019051 [Cardiocondyla obscurior]|uniref:Secreted protein n=1 Tax=Cardiocondyla obscurior TaxID=286306 RepID=A0AAW2EH08_9HYME